MITLSVPDMNCGHCKASVEKALSRVDPAAAVTVDIPARRVTVETKAEAPALIAALAAVGFASAPAA